MDPDQRESPPLCLVLSWSFPTSLTELFQPSSGARLARQCAPSPSVRGSVRGSVAPSRSVTLGRSPSPTVSRSPEFDDNTVDRKPKPVRESSEEAKPRFKRPSPVDRLVENIVTTKHEDDGDEPSRAPENEKSAETLELDDEIAALKVS